MKPKTLNDIERELQEHYEAGNNVLVSRGTDITPMDMFEARINVVYVSSNRDDEESYESQKKYRLNSKALLKIAGAGDVKWDANLSAPVYHKDNNVKAYKATGKILTASGEWSGASAYADLDLAIEKEILEGKYKDPKQHWMIARDYGQKAKNATKICETMAKARVVRVLYPELKSGYRKDQIEKPFVIISYSVSVDFKDPTIAKILIAGKLKSALNIYGPSPETQQIEAPIDADFQEVTPENDNNVVDPDTSEPTAAEDMTSDECFFMSQATKEKIYMLKNLIKEKNYTENNFTDEHMATFSDKNMLSFFQKLQTMPGIKKDDSNIKF